MFTSFKVYKIEKTIIFRIKMCGNSQAKRAERSGLPRFFFGYFLCSNDKESNISIIF
jgi:hypothetical protein